MTTPRPSQPTGFTLPRSVVLVGSVVLLPALMAVLAVACTMLTRMLVEREQEPDLHLPTFWVWFGLCMAGIALPILIHEFRGPARGGPARDEITDGSRIRLAFLQEEAGPVTRVSLRLPDASGPSVTLVRAHELEPSDVPLLEQIADPAHGLARGDGDSFELTPSGIAALTASDGTLRSVIDELLWQEPDGAEPAEPAGPVTATATPADLGAGASAGSHGGRSHLGPTTVPHGSRRRALTRVARVLIALLCLEVVVMLAWRFLSDEGIGPDIDDHDWAVTFGAGAVLVGPFVIWGWYGLMHYVTMRESAGRSGPVARQALQDFWFFGLCSALVMVLLGGVATMAVWVTTEGLLPTLISLAVTAGFAGLARVSLRAHRSAGG